MRTRAARPPPRKDVVPDRAVACWPPRRGTSRPPRVTAAPAGRARVDDRLGCVEATRLRTAMHSDGTPDARPAATSDHTPVRRVCDQRRRACRRPRPRIQNPKTPPNEHVATPTRDPIPRTISGRGQQCQGTGRRKNKRENDTAKKTCTSVSHVRVGWQMVAARRPAAVDVAAAGDAAAADPQLRARGGGGGGGPSATVGMVKPRPQETHSFADHINQRRTRRRMENAGGPAGSDCGSIGPQARA